ALGITGGAHRLWSHRSYQAHFPARLVMMLANSIANQGSIYHWSRDHRVHHAKSDTESDPHDITRGLFYSHMGWLLLKKRQAVKEAGKKIDCSDLMADPLVRIQHVCDPFWNQFFCFGLPTLVAWYYFDEALLGFTVMGCARWLLCLHATWCVNSVAHAFGPRPYTPNMYPSENLWTTVVAVGEGYHNWHHTYPWDYAAAELGGFQCYNPTTTWIDFLALIGQAYGRKRATHKKPKMC
ncbi:Delta(9)-fatty-acid desaturase fat-7, partial [Diplonema papillatum]